MTPPHPTPMPSQPLLSTHTETFLQHPPTAPLEALALSVPTTPTVARRLSLPDISRLKEEWLSKEAHQINHLPLGKLQIDLLNIRSDISIKRPMMRLRMGSQHYFSSRSKDAHGNWNEGFMFTVSYHNQLFDIIELDLYDKRKGWRAKTRHIGKAKLKLGRLKGRDDVFVTFLPMYEYNVRRYLPAHIQLPHNFLKSHMPTLPTLPTLPTIPTLNQLRGMPSAEDPHAPRKTDKHNPHHKEQEHHKHHEQHEHKHKHESIEREEMPPMEFKQHPSHARHSMMPYIGSIQIRVRYTFQTPPDVQSDELMPVYLPYNHSRDFDACSFTSSHIESSTIHSAQSHASTSSSSLSIATTYSADRSGVFSSETFHDAVEPMLVMVETPRAAGQEETGLGGGLGGGGLSAHRPVQSESTVDLLFEQRLKSELSKSPSVKKVAVDRGVDRGVDREMFGFSQCDIDHRSHGSTKEGGSSGNGSSGHGSLGSHGGGGGGASDTASIRSHNFGDKNFAFRWMNESFEEVALSHPSLDRMIGLVVSPQTRTLLRAVVKMCNAFGQGFKITGMQLLSSLSTLQGFYGEIPRPPPPPKITDLKFVDEAYYYLGHAIIAYGWRGLSYLGDYAKYLKDVMKTKSNKEAIVRFLKIPPEDLLGYEYGLRKGAVFQPSYFVSIDRNHEAIVVGIRGTWSLYDCITDLVCEYRPWKGGLVHSGMLASAQWFFTRIIPQIFHYVAEQSKSPTRPISSIVITGHSLGAGTAALLTMMVADHLDELRQLSDNPNFKVHCYGYAPVASVSLDISEKYKHCIDSFVCHDDLVARLSYGTATCAKELIMDSLTAADGLGGSSKVNSDPDIKKACFDIIQTRRQEIYHANEPRYPLLYVPGRVFQFCRTLLTPPKKTSTTTTPRTTTHSTRPRAASSVKEPPPKGPHPLPIPFSQSEPSLGVSSGSSASGNTSFTLHQSSPLISEEILVSKTCLEDHMVVTYLNAFQMVRDDCMKYETMAKLHHVPPRTSSRGISLPSITVRDPEGRVV
ncbi:hypothetical protein BDF14DRAFT_1843298 [Spinellus fusiger]|nr:hypothetical protein BDF14DRAFT_1843298 [Spinellus fusiger]